MSNPFDQFSADMQAALPPGGAAPVPVPAPANNGFPGYAAPAPAEAPKPPMNAPPQQMYGQPPPAYGAPPMQVQAYGVPPQPAAPIPQPAYDASQGFGATAPQQAIVPAATQTNPYALGPAPSPYGAPNGFPGAPAAPAPAPPAYDAANPFGAPATAAPPAAMPSAPDAANPFEMGGSPDAYPPAPAAPDGGNPYGAPPPPGPDPTVPQADPWGAPPSGQPPADPIYGGAPPPADPYAAPPTPQPPYGAPPTQPPPFGVPPTQPGAPPTPQPPYGAPPAPVPADPFAAPGAGAIVPVGAAAHDPFAVFTASAPPPAPQPAPAYGAPPPAPQPAPAYGAPPPPYGAPPPGPGALVPAPAAAPDDDFFASMGFEPAVPAPAPEPSVDSSAQVQSGELPPGGEWYDARIFTPTLGVMFFKPQELTDSLFLNTEKSIVDALQERPVVAFIVEGSSARSAGVELGHVLLKVNGIDVKNPKEASRLIKEGPRPLPLLFYVPSTEVVVAEGEHMVKYDTRDTTAPNSAKDWKPKYVVIGGIIAQPWMMNMYRSKSEYDIAVIETQARRPVSVKVKQFSLQGARIQNDWQGPQMVKYKNKLHPWKYIVILPVARNPIKISSPNLSQLKPVHEGIRRVLLAQQRDRGQNPHGAGPPARGAPYGVRGPPKQSPYGGPPPQQDPYGPQGGYSQPPPPPPAGYAQPPPPQQAYGSQPPPPQYGQPPAQYGQQQSYRY